MTSPLSHAGVGAPIRSPLFDYVMETAGGGEPWQHGPDESSVAFFHLGNLAWPLVCGFGVRNHPLVELGIHVKL